MQAVREAELALKLEGIFSETLGQQLDVGTRNAKISELDIPSLMMMLMLVQIENECDLQFGGDDFDKIADGTFDDFVALIVARRAER